MKKHKLIAFLIFLSGCQLNSINKNQSTLALENQKGLIKTTLSTHFYDIQSWLPQQQTSPILRIYIEGDGRAWLRKGRASGDPTPKHRLVHSLMLNDSKADIAYLARPCQYVMSTLCTRQSWTFGRYDPPAIQSINQAINKIKHRLSYKEIELVGYSGGATIALLIAAKRDDVASVRTIAGNLTPHFTNRYHQVTEMPTADTPLNHTTQLMNIPQLHFFGSEDRVIPKQISKHYKLQFDQKECIKLQEAEAASHGRGWSKRWKDLLNEKFDCRQEK